MKQAPNSKVNLDRAISRFAGPDRSPDLVRNTLANAIVAQMLPEGVVKGGTSLKFRYGSDSSRATMDLDTAWSTGLDEFLSELRKRLSQGWGDFRGELLVRRQASPKGVPFAYVMQPCDVKLSYRGVPWYTVQLEVGHNEIGDADRFEEVPVPSEIVELCDFLCIPVPGSIRAMLLEYQVAQKLHGASAPDSRRAHDLIDLQLIFARQNIDLVKTRDICHKLFDYRKTHAWPPHIVSGDNWESIYNAQRRTLPVLPTVDEAIAWTNVLIDRIESSSGRKETRNMQESYSTLGNTELLKVPKVAFLSSRKISPEAVMGAHAWASKIRETDTCVISGFQSELEKDVLKFLLRGTCPVIQVIARKLPKTMPVNLRTAAAAGRVLLISIASDKKRRAGETEAIRRNKFVLSEASSYVFGSLDPAGNLANLASKLPKVEMTVLG